jgi:hypothetical protein
MAFTVLPTCKTEQRAVRGWEWMHDNSPKPAVAFREYVTRESSPLAMRGALSDRSLPRIASTVLATWKVAAKEYEEVGTNGWNLVVSVGVFQVMFQVLLAKDDEETARTPAGFQERSGPKLEHMIIIIIKNSW